jgi:hypothetical protein
MKNPPPFVGLSAFTPHTAHYFTGRSRFALTLAGTTMRSRIALLFGTSGCGKSSVLGAALPQALRAILARPEGRAGFDDDEPRSREAFRLLQFRRWHRGFEDRLFRVAAAKLRAGHGVTLRSAITEWRDGGHGPVVLVLDQFEEFLLYHPDPLASPLIRQLSELVADERLDAQIVISLREDSVAPLDRLRPVLPGILASPIQLLPLDQQAARDAILQPVAEWSRRNLDGDAVAVEDALVTDLLGQVRVNSPGSAYGPHRGFVELPLLQLALERLWLEETRAGRVTGLHWKTLAQLGGVAGIVRRHLQETIGRLSSEQRELAAELMGHLVTASGAKHAWRADDLAKELAAPKAATSAAAAQSRLGRVTGAIAGIPEVIGRWVDLASQLPRRAFGARRPQRMQGRPATVDEVGDTLGQLASGRARILRTQPDPQGKGPLFDLLHDALAQPVLEWVQRMRIAAATRRQIRNASGLVLLTVAVLSFLLYLFLRSEHKARLAEEQATLAQEETTAAQLQESRAVAILARQATDSGDAMTGMLAALPSCRMPTPDGSDQSALRPPWLC